MINRNPRWAAVCCPRFNAPFCYDKCEGIFDELIFKIRDLSVCVQDKFTCPLVINNQTDMRGDL